MRWSIEVTPTRPTPAPGDASPSPETFVVEAKSWQTALQEARSQEPSAGPISQLSIELLADGYRATDPTTKTRYLIRKTAADTPLRAGKSPNSSPTPEPPPVSTPAPASAPAVQPPVSSPASTLLMNSASGPVSSQAATAAPVAAPPPSSAPAPATVVENSSVPSTSVAPPAPVVSPGNDPDAIPSFDVVMSREEQPSEKSPLTYREIVYSVPPGTSEQAAERLLRKLWADIAQQLWAAPPGKFINLAVFNVAFSGRPPKPPLVTLTWKDWRGPTPDIAYPLRQRTSQAPPSGSSIPPVAIPPNRAPSIPPSSAGGPPTQIPPTVQSSPSPTVTSPPSKPSVLPTRAAPPAEPPSVEIELEESAPPAPVAPAAPPKPGPTASAAAQEAPAKTPTTPVTEAAPPAPEVEIEVQTAEELAPEPPKVEAVSKAPEVVPTEQPKVEAPAEAPKTEVAPAEAPKVEAAPVEAPKAEAPEAEAPKAEAAKEEPKAEEPKVEEPKVEEPKVEAAKVEAAKVEEPKVEEPKVEAVPETQESKTEAPKAEEPKAEAPKVEAAKEEPKVEAPRTETPKAEDAKASSEAPAASTEGVVAEDPFAAPAKADDGKDARGKVVKQKRRLSGDDLLGDLFEAMHDVHFQPGVLEGAHFVLWLAVEKMPCKVAVCHLFDINRREFVVTHVLGECRKEMLLKRAPERESLIHQVMRRRRALVLSGSDMLLDGERWGLLGQPVRSAVVAPVVLGGRFLGLLELVNPVDGAPFLESDGYALAYIGEQFAEFLGQRGLLLDPEAIANFRPPKL